MNQIFPKKVEKKISTKNKKKSFFEELFPRTRFFISFHHSQSSNQEKISHHFLEKLQRKFFNLSKIFSGVKKVQKVFFYDFEKICQNFSFS